MPVPHTTPELESLIKGAEAFARLPLGDCAAATLGVPGGRIDLLRTAGPGPAHAAVLHGAGLFERTLLGRCDDAVELVRHASAMAFAADPATLDLSGRALVALAGNAGPRELPEPLATLVESYAGGEFAWLGDVAREHGMAEFERRAASAGDGLLAFLAREIDGGVDADAPDGALERLAVARREIEEVEAALSSRAPAP